MYDSSGRWNMSTLGELPGVIPFGARPKRGVRAEPDVGDSENGQRAELAEDQLRALYQAAIELVEADDVSHLLSAAGPPGSVAAELD